MNGQLYDYIIEMFKRDIAKHAEEVMVGKRFNISYGGRTYSLIIDEWKQVDVDLTATFEMESPWWKRG